MVHSMKMGWMKPPSQVKKEKEEQKDEMKTYDLWANEDEVSNLTPCAAFLVEWNPILTWITSNPEF